MGKWMRYFSTLPQREIREKIVKSNQERRRYQRHKQSFEVEIYATTDDGDDFNETVTLNDISDAGLSFTSQQPDHYYVNQAISATILGADSIRMKAKVIWIRWSNGRDGNITMAVGVALKGLIETRHFENVVE